MRWSLKSELIPNTVDELRTIIFSNRQITNENDFLDPIPPDQLSLEDVGIDPQQVASAVKLLLEAKAANKKVLVFGDYDADGISATTVLWQTLFHLGVKALPFIPHREKHGYGLSNRALDEILADGQPDLIITVDNGIVAVEPVARLKAAGVQVIITDHHQPEVNESNNQVYFPDADAIVHTTKLCGTTVAWMLARELSPETAQDSLDMCGLATIADQVPLVNANRSFAYWGIEALKKTQRVGLRELAKMAAIDLPSISTSGVNFGLVPRINAMGRVSHGMDALRLLCTTSKERAEQLVETLHVTNLRRQDLTGAFLSQARADAEKASSEHIIISASPDYHEGVIGLIAGRLMEEYSKPAIVISVGELVAKASARSIEGINIVELIRQVRDDLLEVGGHPMAAGFGLLPEKIETVTKRLQSVAKENILAEQLQPTIRLECILPLNLVDFATTDLLKTLEPFGQGNHQPVFGLKGLEVSFIQTMGKENKHLKMKLRHLDSTSEIVVLAWHQAKLADAIEIGSKVDLAGILEVNEWKGRRSLQIVAKDVVPILE